MPHAIARELRKEGIDVVTATDTGLRGRSDAEHLTHAHTTGRVMVTQDRDYLRLDSVGQQHNGIAYCRQGTRSIGEIVDALMAIHEVYEAEEMVGRVEYL